MRRTSERGAGRPRILLTLADRPWPADGGKRMRARAVLSALAALDVDVDVLVVMAGPPSVEPVEPGVAVGRVLQVDEPLRRLPGAALSSVARRVPWQVGVVRWGRVRRVVRTRLAPSYDLVWFGATDHATSLGRAVQAGRVVVDMDDVETAKLRGFLALPPHVGASSAKRRQRRLELPLWAGLERRVLRTADLVVVCSELDRTRLARKNVRVVPNGYHLPADEDRPAARNGPPTVLLVGTFSYPPNADAAAYAAREVLPRLRERVPDARLRLVGRGSAALPADLAGLPGVELVGEVESTTPELRSAGVAIVPVRYGGGTRIKILEAFAHGVPVVSTALGCEGLDAEDGLHLIVRDGAQALADACADLLEDPERALRLGAAGRRLLEQGLTSQHVARAVQDVVAEVLPGASAHA